MRVVVVPFNLPSGTHLEPSCTSAYGEISDATKQQFHDALFKIHPVDTLEIEWRAPRDLDGIYYSLGGLNAAHEAIRAAEDPDNPEKIYLGIVDPCDFYPVTTNGFPDC